MSFKLSCFIDNIEKKNDSLKNGDKREPFVIRVLESGRLAPRDLGR